MNDLFYRLKRMPYYASYPVIFCAAFLLMINALSLFDAESLSGLYSSFYSGISALFSVSVCGFLTYYLTKSSKKAVSSCLCILFFDTALFSLCAVHISLVFGLIFSLAFSYLFKKYDLPWAFALCSLICLLAALIFGLIYDKLYSVMLSVCSALKGRGALFGAINNLYSILFSDNFSAAFFRKEYSGTAYSDGRVVSGVLNIFNAQKVAGTNAARYLTGKYFINIFASFPIFMILFSRLEDKQKAALSLCLALSLVFGDIRLFSLFILLCNPLMYLGFLLLCFISYFAAYLLDIRIMYFKDGSLFELFRYMDKAGYFFIAGIIIFALSYFLESIIISKFDFQSRKILPGEVRQIIDALGGERNIERIRENDVLLRNANLINILKLDCEIKGNTAVLDYDDMRLLKRFFSG